MKYGPGVLETLAKLRSLGALVIHGVDATRLLPTLQRQLAENGGSGTDWLGDGFDRVTFQFPLCGATLSKAEFEAKFRSSPQVLRGVTTDWAAQAHWSSSAALLTRWGERTKFRVGDDESNEPVLMRLDDYVRYLPR